MIWQLEVDIRWRLHVRIDLVTTCDLVPISHTYRNLTESGRVYAWGFNACGRLGLGHETSINIPTLVEPLADKQVIRIACGLDHSLFITAI